ncbi:MAG TPA: hypothetical protein P5161_00730, partial [Eubacteriales bacterium]|nr:hypothetical protein [Eubacteriales bacterium]
NIGIITAAEQQTMNYYMNQNGFYSSDIGRKLFQEIAMIEEQHVTHYGSLMDTTCSWLAGLLEHEYTECYLYYSCFMDETDKDIKKIWERHFEQEVAHLHRAAELLEKYEGRHWSEVIPVGEFPELIKFHPNKEYVRGVLSSVRLTSVREDYSDVDTLPKDFEFFTVQKQINSSLADVASHKTIDRYIKEFGKDYRYEIAPHPIADLRSRVEDNTSVGR